MRFWNSAEIKKTDFREFWSGRLGPDGQGPKGILYGRRVFFLAPGYKRASILKNFMAFMFSYKHHISDCGFNTCHFKRKNNGNSPARVL